MAHVYKEKIAPLNYFKIQIVMAEKVLKKYFIYTLGCRSNQYDSEWLRKYLQGSGFVETPKVSEADVVIINSCVVTHKAERDVRKLINRANRLRSPDSSLILTGCMVPLKRDVDVDYQGSIEEVKEFLRLKVPVLPKKQSRTRAVLRIQDGCSFSCTYCIVPKVRGPAKSRPIEEIIKEAEDLVSLGYKEIVITGTQVGGWGRDLGYSLSELFKRILNLSPDIHIRVSSILPHYLTVDLLDLWAKEDRILPHFHLPLQSGSPGILRAMKRPYTIESYKNLINEIKRRLPDAGIGTDIIVGFPGESDDDFEETLKVVMDLPFTYLHIFEFSPREGTPAASMKDQIPPEVRKERIHRLLSIANDKKLRFMEAHIGKPLKVMVERHIDSVYLGTSVNYLKLKIHAENLSVGDYVVVKPSEIEFPFMLATLSAENQALSTNVKHNALN